MNCKHMFIVLIGNLAVLTALHYNTVNCLQIFRRRHSSSHRPATLQYYHVPYNIYGTKQFLERRNAPIMLSPANLRALELQAFQHKYQAQIPFQQQFQQLLQQPYNDQMLRRQLTIGNPIRAPLPVRALGKSRRLFTSFLNLRQSQLLTSVLAGPLALATVIFALPLLPSLLMAPLAFAGLPQAMTMVQDFMHSFGAGGSNGVGSGKPINSLFSSFIDPLVSPLGIHHPTAGDSSAGNKPGKLNLLKHIARIFRVGINRRVAAPPHADNTTALSSTIDPLLDPDGIVDENDILSDISANITESIYDLPGNQTDPLSATSPSSSNLDGTTAPSDNADNLLSSIPDPVINQLNNSDLKKSFRSMENMFGSIREIYSIIREGLRRYEITDSQCQSRIVCEIHQKIVGRKRSMLKSFALNAIDVLSIESRVDGWNNLNDKSKEAIKFYISAAKKGLADENCETEFDKCPTLPLKSRMLRSLLLDSGHLIKSFKRSL